MRRRSGLHPELGMAVLRVVLGVIFIAHGAPKLLGGVGGLAGALEGIGFPAPFAWAWFVTVLEFFGGLALIVGLLVTPIALLLSVEMGLGIVLVHAAEGWYVIGPGTGGVEFNVLLIASLLALVFAGPGLAAIDRLRGSEVPVAEPPAQPDLQERPAPAKESARGSAMLDGSVIVERLAAERVAGATRDELLRRAVEAIEAADDRFDWVGIYLLDRTEGRGGREGADPGDGRPLAGSEPRPASRTPGPARRELVLHNYIGRATDHTRIAVGSGVCGTAVAEERDINVPDVRAIDNYLACSAETRSELVVLIRDPASGAIYGQLDLDSDRRAAFGERDQRELRVVADWLAGLFG